MDEHEDYFAKEKTHLKAWSGKKCLPGKGIGRGSDRHHRSESTRLGEGRPVGDDEELEPGKGDVELHSDYVAEGQNETYHVKKWK